MKLITEHEIAKQIWDTAEAAELASAIAANQTLTNTPVAKIGSLMYNCRVASRGERPVCLPGLCCGKGTLKGKEESVINEVCYTATALVYGVEPEDDKDMDEAAKKAATIFWDFACIE